MSRRLSLLMFLLYAVPGAWVPIFSLHLQELNFSPQEIAWACSTTALGALAAPLIWGQVADRWLAAERCITCCSLLVAFLLFFLANVTGPLAVFLVSLGCWFFTIPIYSLGASLTFRHLQNPEKEFGWIRMWGTVGWVAANLALGLWFYWQEHALGKSDLSDSLRWAGLLALALAGYSLTLPATPPSEDLKNQEPGNEPQNRGTGSKIFSLPLPSARSLVGAPLQAAQLFRHPSFAVYCFCLLGLYVTMPFTSQLTPLLLNQLGISDALLPVVLTLAQSLEVVTLGMLPMILLRLETRATLLTGIVSWTAGLAVLAVGWPTWLVIASLGTQGVYVCCFLIAGQVFVNSLARNEYRASAQALLQFTNGAGLLCGHLFVGGMRTWTDSNFHILFATATGIATCLFLVFLVGFRGKDPFRG